MTRNHLRCWRLRPCTPLCASRRRCLRSTTSVSSPVSPQILDIRIATRGEIVDQVACMVQWKPGQWERFRDRAGWSFIEPGGTRSLLESPFSSAL